MNINIICRKRQNILQKESNMMLEEQLFFEKLENELPPVFTRNEVSKQLLMRRIILFIG